MIKVRDKESLCQEITAALEHELPHPESAEHIVFEGCDFVAIAPEDYEKAHELLNNVYRGFHFLEADRDYLLQSLEQMASMPSYDQDDSHRLRGIAQHTLATRKDGEWVRDEVGADLHALLDEKGAPKESGGVTLAVSGRIRALWSKLVQEANQVRSSHNSCARSHPHESMDQICELRTEVARLEYEQATRTNREVALCKALESILELTPDYTSPETYYRDVRNFAAIGVLMGGER